MRRRERRRQRPEQHPGPERLHRRALPQL